MYKFLSCECCKTQIRCTSASTVHEHVKQCAQSHVTDETAAICLDGNDDNSGGGNRSGHPAGDQVRPRMESDKTSTEDLSTELEDSETVDSLKDIIQKNLAGENLDRSRAVRKALNLTLDGTTSMKLQSILLGQTEACPDVSVSDITGGPICNQRQGFEFTEYNRGHHTLEDAASSSVDTSKGSHTASFTSFIRNVDQVGETFCSSKSDQVAAKYDDGNCGRQLVDNTTQKHVVTHLAKQNTASSKWGQLNLPLSAIEPSINYQYIPIARVIAQPSEHQQGSTSQAHLCHSCRKIISDNVYSIEPEDLCTCCYKFRCKLCHTLFAKVMDLRKHFQDYHDFQKCLCGMSFVSLESLQAHRGDSRSCPAEIVANEQANS